MNSDQALDHAARDATEVGVLLKDMIDGGVVDFLIAGAHVSGDPNDALPTICIHLKHEGSDFVHYRNQIIEMTAAIRDKGTGVSIFPKRPTSVGRMHRS